MDVKGGKPEKSQDVVSRRAVRTYLFSIFVEKLVQMVGILAY